MFSVTIQIVRRRVHARVMDFRKHNNNIYSRGQFEYLIINGGTRLSESNELTAIVVVPYYILY